MQNRRKALGTLFTVLGLCISTKQLGAAVAPFFASSQTSGSVSVRLYPTEGAHAGSPVLVTFGFPFPQASVTPSALNMVRILSDGNEIPASVELLTPWRHATNTSKDGRHVRVARIQFTFTPSVAFPKFENITVEWGRTARIRNVAFQNPRNGWRLVTTGGFTSTDQVYEPSVYAVLPPSVLAKGVFTGTQIHMFPAKITEPRSDPSVPKPSSWTNLHKIEAGMRDFFYNIANRDDPKVSPVNLCPFKTVDEPWLYDRAASMYTLYFQSGWINPLREAVRNSQFYVRQLFPESSPIAGVFKFKQPSGTTSGPNTTMYSYIESLAYTYWLTGDDVMRDHMTNAVTAHNKWGVVTRWSPSVGFWTERAAGVKLLANVIGFEVFGSTNYRANALKIADDLIWHQNGAGGALPANRIDGGLWHYGRQHSEGAEGSLVASAWMSLLAETAMVRTYAMTEDDRVADFIRRMAKLYKAASRSDNGHEYGSQWGSLEYPDYLTRVDGSPEMRSSGDAEHTFEAATGTAWAAYFGGLLDRPDTSLPGLLNELERTQVTAIQYWTRPNAPASGLSAYRVSPWRKYAMQYREAPSYTWLRIDSNSN